MIIANTVILALDKYPEMENANKIMEYSNMAFAGFFMLETLLKLLGLGFKGFVKDRYNILDTFIVVLSIIDITVA